jgi:hypothetical protein
MANDFPPRAGYKIVSRDTWQDPRLEAYTVGSTHVLAPGVEPRLDGAGFSFCRDPLHCLGYFPCELSAYRLLAVSVPADAVVVGDGTLFRASKLVVEFEVESPASLLTGSLTHTTASGETYTAWYVGGALHDGPNGEPAMSVRRPDHVWCQWFNRDVRHPNVAVYHLDGMLAYADWPPPGCRAPPQTVIYTEADEVSQEIRRRCRRTKDDQAALCEADLTPLDGDNDRV